MNPIKNQALKQHYVACDVDSDVTIALVSKMIIMDRCNLPKATNTEVKMKIKGEEDEKRRLLIEKYREQQKKLQSGEGFY